MFAWGKDYITVLSRGGHAPIKGGMVKGIVTGVQPSIGISLERAQEKWTPVFRRDTRKNNTLELDGDARKSHPAQGRKVVRFLTDES